MNRDYFQEKLLGRFKLSVLKKITLTTIREIWTLHLKLRGDGGLTQLSWGFESLSAVGVVFWFFYVEQLREGGADNLIKGMLDISKW